MVFQMILLAKWILLLSMSSSALSSPCLPLVSPTPMSSTNTSISQRLVTVSAPVSVDRMLYAVCTRIATSISRCKRISFRNPSSTP
ncbi:hypothetical protein EMPG_16153 [Blastomyces silverae]|uniref:Secreted protein n=1 Tax=Blastomyces silverae TaxID=2060906 RepID=A0A0H1BAM5_9EURO|nr:hypothetical protein EMPG_16153 [Blastomyces silverae]